MAFQPIFKPLFSPPQLSKLEIQAESLMGAMDEKDRELAKSAEIRAAFAADTEALQAWTQAAEVRCSDRAKDPKQLKQQLTAVNDEMGAAAEQLERVNKNGSLLAEKSRAAGERELVSGTCGSLTDSLAHVRHVLEQKKMAVS